MLLEELLTLPIGTCVFGELEDSTVLLGTIESRGSGRHFIRWSDGAVTRPFGTVRDYDEYIASRIELSPMFHRDRPVHQEIPGTEIQSRAGTRSAARHTNEPA